MLGLLSKKGGSGSGGASDASGFGADLNEVDLSLVVRMQLGQQSRRFARARYVNYNFCLAMTSKSTVEHVHVNCLL